MYVAGKRVEDDLVVNMLTFYKDDPCLNHTEVNSSYYLKVFVKKIPDKCRCWPTSDKKDMKKD